MTKLRPTFISVRGARQNNLRGVDVDFPRSRLSVITGVSGSGKSSLALDTIYAEGQRRYVASLSTYAQQFLERLPRPQVDSIEGLPPAIAIEQANPIMNRRSTVGTATEVYDYLRVLYARAATLVCPECRVPVRPLSPSAAAAALAAENGRAWYVTFALPISEALTHEVLVENLRALGFLRLIAAGREVHLDEAEGLDLTRLAPLFVVVDRISLGTPATRIAESIERAYAEGEGEAVVFERGRTTPQDGRRFSRHYRCDGCGRGFPRARPTLFSFNNPYGACPTCGGFGNLLEFDPHLIVPDTTRSLEDDAIDPWTMPRYAKRRERVRASARAAGLPWKTPWEELPEGAREALIHGGRFEGERFEGVIPFLEDLTRKKYKAWVRFFLRRYQSYRVCPDCAGSRLRCEASWFEIAGRPITEIVTWPLPRVARWIEESLPSAGPAGIVTPILRELRRRVGLLLGVGLDYLTLDRLTRSLSGGEAQRIGIANALGSPLTDGVYVLDEPSVGLHARDTGRIVGLLRELTERGNTVLVVEHDLDVVRAAARVIELGPGSGMDGGRLVFSGAPAELAAAGTRRGAWLKGEAALPERRRREPTGPWLSVRGARAHNLADVDVDIPLRALTAVTGVSGSGKSTLVHDVLYRGLAARMGGNATRAHLGEEIGEHDAITGVEWLAGLALVDQSPIGRSPRSNPVTYVKAFDPIRKLFAESPAARRRGFGPGHFSFNTRDGRCPECGGDGHRRIEMHFLPDVFVTCDGCRGRRYRPEILTVEWRGRSIADVLAMTVDEASRLFEGEHAAARGLRVLRAVGLGYLALGQPATTLSGGESQRLKIARELALVPAARRRSAPARGTLYLLDEPTTGLHGDDMRALVRVLDELVARGNTVVIVEHHLDMIARSDWVVDLGPEGGAGGGRVVAAGPPDGIVEVVESRTGMALAARRAARRERLVS